MGLYVVAALLSVIAVLCGYFGPDYEINKISAAERAHMTDFDWIGAEWIAAAIYLWGGAVLTAWIGWWIHGRALKRERTV